mmetsp:Transcript_7491/g.12655  ORF Transcript_7491/g.12655 Transcript_7491/m.12655 type:complete len:150 (-) Transcript_7491:37-486(-)
MQHNLLSSKQQQRQDPQIREGEDFYKKLFTFIQRKVEYENFRFKHPSLVAVVIEAINTKITDNQRMFRHLFYRFHVSQDLSVKDLQETVKFKINSRIESSLDKISKKDKVIFFNENISVSEHLLLRDLYIEKREDDGWLYLDFLVEAHL